MNARFTWSTDQQDIAAALRTLLASEAGADDLRAAWNGAADNRRWKALADIGAFGLAAPVSVGGTALGMEEVGILALESGRVALPERISVIAGGVVPLLVAAGREGLAAQVIAGQHRVGWALASEHDRVLDLLVSDAVDAEVILVIGANEAYLAEPSQFGLHDAGGVDRANLLQRITVDTRLAGADRLQIAQNSLDASRDAIFLATAAELCGLGFGMLAMSVEYAKIREQFGQPIGAFQAIKHQLADVKLALESAWSVVEYGLSTHAQGSDLSLAAPHAMVDSISATHLAGRVALQVHGAMGYSQELPLHMFLKKAWTSSSLVGGRRWHFKRASDALRQVGFSPLLGSGRVSDEGIV